MKCTPPPQKKKEEEKSKESHDLTLLPVEEKRIRVKINARKENIFSQFS